MLVIPGPEFVRWLQASAVRRQPPTHGAGERGLCITPPPNPAFLVAGRFLLAVSLARSSEGAGEECGRGQCFSVAFRRDGLGPEPAVIPSTLGKAGPAPGAREKAGGVMALPPIILLAKSIGLTGKTPGSKLDQRREKHWSVKTVSRHLGDFISLSKSLTLHTMNMAI